MRGIFEPLDQMDRRTARFIDRGEVGLDHMGDDIAGMNPDPDQKRRIVQQLDPANQFDRRVTGHDGVIVVGMRGAKKRDQPVAAFLADDSAVAANGGAHRNQRRLEPGNRRLGVQLRDQIGRALQIGAEHREIFPLAGDAAANFGSCWRMFGDDRTAGRAIHVAGFQGRLTNLTTHPRLLHPPGIQISERSWRNKHLQPHYAHDGGAGKQSAGWDFWDGSDWVTILAERIIACGSGSKIAHPQDATLPPSTLASADGRRQRTVKGRLRPSDTHRSQAAACQQLPRSGRGPAQKLRRHLRNSASLSPRRPRLKITPDQHNGEHREYRQYARNHQHLDMTASARKRMHYRQSAAIGR